MKKILILLAAILVLGCDDGDMSFKTFDFSNVNAQRCSSNNILYKINGTEALLLDIDPAFLVNIETVDGEPRVVPITISGTNKIIYRNYSSTISGSAICSDLPPARPSVSEEWKGEGTVNIITTARYNDDDEIIGYAHNIILVDVSFTKSGETVRIVNNSFGEINSSLGYTFDFGGDEENPTPVQQCENGIIYKINQDEALTFAIDLSLFTTIEGTTDVDLSIIEDNNQVIFDKYSGFVSAANICSAISPVTPVVTTRWNAVSGTLRIVTEYDNSLSQYIHKLYLSNTVFQNSTGEGFFVGVGTDYFIGIYTQ